MPIACCGLSAIILNTNLVYFFYPLPGCTGMNLSDHAKIGMPKWSCQILKTACVSTCFYFLGFFQGYYRRASANMALGKFKQSLKDYEAVSVIYVLIGSPWINDLSK